MFPLFNQAEEEVQAADFHCTVRQKNKREDGSLKPQRLQG